MVSGFRRSLSLPKPNRAPSARPYHVRSTSLPCRSHPSISQLKDQIQTLKTWESDPDRGSSAWLCAGLVRLKRLHESLDDLFQLPQSQDFLRRPSLWVENLLETSLRFVDAYGSFRAALVGLKEAQLAAQVAIRRRDGSKVSSCVKSRKKIERDVARIVAEVRNVRRSCVPVADPDAEVAELVRKANAVTVSVSVSVFCGISWSKGSLKSWIGLIRKGNKIDGGAGAREFQDAWGENLSRWKDDEKMALGRMKVCEEWLVEIEKESERLFRSLINARVSLLNGLTQ